MKTALLPTVCLEHVYPVPSELSPIIPLESDMKQQEHLWQNQSPNFLAEKAFNAAVAALEPHCAICSLFHPYEQVIRTFFYKVTAQNQRSLSWFRPRFDI